MKNRIIPNILTFLFFIQHSFFFSQSVKIDSLLTVLKTTKEDTIKVNTLNNLFLQVEFSDDEKAEEYLKKALELSQKIGYKKGLASTYIYLGYFAEDKGNYTDALKNYFASLKTREAMGDKKGIADSYNNIGNVYYSQGNYSEALKNHLTSLKIKEALGDKKGIASSYNNIGSDNSAQGNYSVALKNYLASLKIREIIGDKKEIAASYNNIGNVYFLQGNFPEALKNYFASVKIREEMGDKKGIANSYGNIGTVYSDQGNYPEALKYHLASLKIDESIGNKKGIGASYNNIGNVYENQGNYSEALKNYMASLKIKEAIGDKAGIVSSFGSIGNVFIQKKKYKEAEGYLLKAKELSKKIGFKEYLRDTYRSLTGLDSARKDFKGAYEHHKLYILYRDSLDNEETRKKIVQNQMTYDFEKKEAATKAEQDKKDAVVGTDRKKQKIVIWSVISGLFLVIVFAGFIFRSLRITHKQKNIIELQKTEVEKAKQIIEEKNKDITDSINYAKKIQEAIFPDKEIKYRIFPDAFVLFQPRDIVSGDFYWFSEKKGRRLIAAVDCTGHGVPGAFMSMIGNAFLNEIVNEGGLTQPDLILNKLRDMIIKSLKQTGFDGHNKDGMDIALLSFDEKNSFVEFAGANNPLWHIRNNSVTKIYANKQPIGYYSETPDPFTNNIIELRKGDALYIFTDGYADQFGGGKGKKFRYKQLEKILLSVQDKPMPEQEKILLRGFNEWKGVLEQTDDVTIAGIRI